MSRQLNDRLAL